MSAPVPELPASTGLPDSGLSLRRQRLVAWTRQALGIYRAAARARLVPSVLAGRFYWILVTQVVLAGVAAWGIAQAGLERIPPEAGWAVSGGALLLLIIHALGRLGGLLSDVLRDVDEQVLDAHDASPLASSAYVAGRSAFHLTEQALGFAALLPAFGLAHALRAIELSQLFAVALALGAVSLTYSLGSIGRVLRAHARRPRGASLPASLRPGAGGLVGVALLGGFAAAGLLGWAYQGVAGAGAVALALCLTPAVPIAAAGSSGTGVELFGRLLPAWALASAWLLLLAPLAGAAARLRWKPPVRASGAGLRAGFALAWLPPAVVLSGSLRPDPVLAALALLAVAGAGALLLPAWAAGSELAGIGDRPGASRRFGWLAGRRDTALAWSLAVQTLTLSLMAALAPVQPGAGRRDWWLLALVALIGTAPAAACSAALARVFVPGRGSVLAVLLVAGVSAALLSALPGFAHVLARSPAIGPLGTALVTPAGLLACASPFVLLPEAAASLLGLSELESWVDLSGRWAAGLPDWLWGVIVASALGYPLAFVLSRWARARGR